MLAIAGDLALGQSLMLSLAAAAGELTDVIIGHDLSERSKAHPFSLDGMAVVFARRIGKGMGAKFVVSSHAYAQGRWIHRVHDVPEGHSGIVCAFGSGAKHATSEVKKWAGADVSGRTSRSVYSGFCDSIRSGTDPATGGAAQLACIYRDWPAKEVGVIWNGEPTIAGIAPSEDAPIQDIEWRNTLFERCDPATGMPLNGAQRHARPYALSNVADLSPEQSRTGRGL